MTFYIWLYMLAIWYFLNIWYLFKLNCINIFYWNCDFFLFCFFFSLYLIATNKRTDKCIVEGNEFMRFFKTNAISISSTGPKTSHKNLLANRIWGFQPIPTLTVFWSNSRAWGAEKRAWRTREYLNVESVLCIYMR